MSEPLVYEIARHFLLRIAQAWEVPPDQLSYRTGGPREMAHHFLKVHLCLTYGQVAGILNTSDSVAQQTVSRGEAMYGSWPAYQQRYDAVCSILKNGLVSMSART